MAPVRVLLLSDTHLGLDLPTQPRVERRHRGDDFVANYHRALEPAKRGEVDLVVHGGDLLYRSQVPAWLVDLALAPLRELADRNIPVALVPGNHERSHIPCGLLAAHPLIHVFDKPRTYVATVRGVRVALAGFPYEGRGVREHFGYLLMQTGWAKTDAHVKLLCMHQCFEGATVGPGDHVFRHADDTVAAVTVPAGLAAVLSGHIHRHQVLQQDLRGRTMATPVLYPGSVERTSFAEKDEPKGYLILELNPEQPRPLTGWKFTQLPARPMVQATLDAQSGAWDTQLMNVLGATPQDAVLQLRVRGPLDELGRAVLRAENLRSLAPQMNINVVPESRSPERSPQRPPD